MRLLYVVLQSVLPLVNLYLLKLLIDAVERGTDNVGTVIDGNDDGDFHE